MVFCNAKFVVIFSLRSKTTHSVHCLIFQNLIKRNAHGRGKGKILLPPDYTSGYNKNGLTLNINEVAHNIKSTQNFSRLLNTQVEILFHS